MIIDNVQFIANVISVVKADGKIHPSEEVQCEEIRKHFKFSKTDWNNAEKLVRKPGFMVKPTGTFADNAVNLEMMIRVACADGEASATEAETVTQFCAEIGITQEQLDALYASVLKELSAHPSRCPKCGAEAPPGAQFCPSCGNVLAAADASVKVEFDIPNTDVAIAFAESESANFPDIYEQASKTQGFQECVKGKKTWYMATFSKKSTDLLKFARIVTSIRNRELYIDGQKTEWAEALPWELVRCADERNEAYDPICYCFGKGDGDSELNPVGCRLLGLSWVQYSGEWARMGQWIQSHSGISWRFDKERIRHYLLTKAGSISMCPFFNPEVIERFLTILPDVVDPQRDKDWDFHSVYGENHPGAIHVIREKGDNGFTFTDDFWSDGLIPKGFGFFKEVITGIYGDQECLKGLI